MRVDWDTGVEVNIIQNQCYLAIQNTGFVLNSTPVSQSLLRKAQVSEEGLKY